MLCGKPFHFTSSIKINIAMGSLVIFDVFKVIFILAGRMENSCEGTERIVRARGSAFSVICTECSLETQIH